jgi:hypothetical protein
LSPWWDIYFLYKLEKYPTGPDAIAMYGQEALEKIGDKVGIVTK